jgi:hypothetical protein
MSRPDDCCLTEQQLANVTKHATLLLKEAAAFGVFPTPIERIMAAAKLTVVEDKFLDEGFLQQFRRAAKSSLDTVKLALGKVLGMLHVGDRLVLIDLHTPEPKKPFIKLHEAGHNALPHQSKLYAFIHDSDHSLDPDTTDLFEREANVFAAETLFQGNGFAIEAHQSEFGIRVPLGLATKYGASKYATFRRYVTTAPKACCVLVLEPAVLGEGKAFTAPIRRFIASRTFDSIFDPLDFGTVLSDKHILGHVVPVGRRMTACRKITLRDRNGSHRTCMAEAFNSTHQIFILIRDAGPAPTIFIPSAGGNKIRLSR